MKRITAAVISLLAVSAVILACKGEFSEISDYGIVGATAIDFEDGQWTVTYEVFSPSSGNDFGGSGVYCSGVGETADSAVESAESKSERMLYTGCNQLYVFGEGVEHSDAFDFLMRDGINMRAISVMACGRADAVLCKADNNEGTAVKSISAVKKIKLYCKQNKLKLPSTVSFLKDNDSLCVSGDGLLVSEVKWDE